MVVSPGSLPVIQQLRDGTGTENNSLWQLIRNEELFYHQNPSRMGVTHSAAPPPATFSVQIFFFHFSSSALGRDIS